MRSCLYNCPAWLGLAKLPPVSQPTLASANPGGLAAFPQIHLTPEPQAASEARQKSVPGAGAVPGHLSEFQGLHRKHTVFDEGRSISLCVVRRICFDSLPGMSCKGCLASSSQSLVKPLDGEPPLWHSTKPITIAWAAFTSGASNPRFPIPLLEVCCPGSVSLVVGKDTCNKQLFEVDLTPHCHSSY